MQSAGKIGMAPAGLFLIILALLVLVVFRRDLINLFASLSGGAEKSLSSKIANVMENTLPPVGQIMDFNRRLDQIDDDGVALLLLTAYHEFERLFKMSPNARSWFLELDPAHQVDLRNQANVLQVRIALHQSRGELSQTPHLMVMLHTARGILDSEITLHAVMMWHKLRERGGDRINHAAESAKLMFGMEFSENDLNSAQYFGALALYEKAKQITG